jgi:hypothetical protein
MPSPIHGKNAFVFISNGGSTNIVSFATEYNISFAPQAVARAPVLGTDAVQGVDGHGYTARARINLYLSEDSPEWDQIFGDFNESPIAGQTNVDFKKAVEDVQAEEAWHTVGKLTVIIAALRNPLTKAVATNFAELLKQQGKIYALYEAAIIGDDEAGRVGDYSTVRLEVETGKYRKVTNQSTIA